MESGLHIQQKMPTFAATFSIIKYIAYEKSPNFRHHRAGWFLSCRISIAKGYEVHGILRRSSSFNTGRIEHLYFDEWVRDMKQKRTINLHYGDMTDSSSLIRIIQQVQPDEIYNLAAQSHVKVSFDVPEYTAEADAVGTVRMLEAVRILGLEKKPASTRLLLPNCSERCRKFHKKRQLRSIPALRTG